MTPEFNGIERRLSELDDRLARLQALADRDRRDLEEDPYLRDAVERNLEIVAQCVIDISNRIVSLEGARKPLDYHDAIVELGEIGVVPADFARQLAPIAGLRNVLVHEYVGVDWSLILSSLEELDQIRAFRRHVARWLASRSQP